MEPVRLDKIKLFIIIPSLAKKLHVSADTPKYRRLEKLAALAVSIARPMVLIKESFIESRGHDFIRIGGITFNTSLFNAVLPDSDRVFPAILTCGKELDHWSAGLHDAEERFWADEIMNHALSRAHEAARTYLTEKFCFTHVSCLSPGSFEEWSLEEQKKLFQLMGQTGGCAGIELNDSFMMTPRYSLSGFFYPSEDDFNMCRACPREECPQRT